MAKRTHYQLPEGLLLPAVSGFHIVRIAIDDKSGQLTFMHAFPPVRLWNRANPGIIFQPFFAEFLQDSCPLVGCQVIRNQVGELAIFR